jgi:integrase/recombinase XerC
MIALRVHRFVRRFSEQVTGLTVAGHLPWVAVQQISTQLRHTALTWIERNFGYAVARAYAGHADSGADAGTTTTYVRASTQEDAAALASLVGVPHPLG